VAEALEHGDIQGIVARAYAELPAAAYLLLSIQDPVAAGQWLGTLADTVTPAEQRPDAAAVNVAVTAHGLARLGLDQDALHMFGMPFVDGMATPYRSRALGDVEEDAPERWAWGGPGTPPVDLVLLLYARDDASLSALEDEHARRLAAGGASLLVRLDTSHVGGAEHFGFRDGISQPIVEGLSKSGPEANTVRNGEFVLGYPNEYGLYTDRPVLDAGADANGLLPRDPQGSGRGDLGRNGSYLVFRQLAQDVRSFRDFVERAARDAGSEAGALAAKIVGRWPSGAPLVLAPQDDPALGDANDFGYHREDPHGLRCPIGAHVRRSNPRDSLDPSPGSAESVAVGKRHRLLRRGRKYGSALAQPEALAPASGPEQEERGLHFICLNANIARQFEFVQHTWINNPQFAGLYDEPDPLIAAAGARGRTFTMPADPVRRRVTGLPSFVSVRGGAYFFLPGLRALRYLAGLPRSQ
jgi:Dyp-type peroxidase family